MRFSIACAISAVVEIEMTPRERMLDASVAAQMRCTEILFLCMSLGRDDLPDWLRASRIKQAREEAEGLLAVIKKAENDNTSIVALNETLERLASEMERA
jgi:hypothetical protein